MQFVPHEYQKEIIKAIRAHNTFVICAMGGGKTAATLEAVRPAKGRILIVAPLRVANHQWPSEIAKWDNFKDMDYAVCTGSLKNRVAALEKNAKITVVNRENVVWLMDWATEQLQATGEWPWSCLVIDESSSFKSHAAKRFKALKKVRKLFKRIVLLTGTPAPNTPLELWSQVCLLDGGERLESGITKFRNRYFHTTDYMGYKWEPNPNAEELITNKISDLCVVIEKYDGLPDRVDVSTPVRLPADAMNRYNAFADRQFAELDGAEITAANAAVVVGKLAQMAGGAVYDDEQNWQHIHDEKIETLREHIEALEGDNVLVAYNYKHERERIMAEFPGAVDIKSEGAIDAWNRGEIPLLLAHPASAGHGLNLWEGGRHIIWFSPTWSNELKQQFDARLWRQGQTENVFIHTLVAQGTVDEDIMAAVAGKKSLQEIVIEKIKEKTA